MTTYEHKSYGRTVLTIPNRAGKTVMTRMRRTLDEILAECLRLRNPNPHPNTLEPPKKLLVHPEYKKQALEILRRQTKIPEKRIREVARAYFGWELMNGADLETLKLDPYWKYMA